MYKCVVKRFLDFLFSFISIPFFIILFIPISISILIDDFGPVFYCGKRIGRNGKEFHMIKFRTMKVNAPDIRLEDGSTYNGKDDPRVTKVGNFLRKTSLDEVPQILNIFVGQMSFIGFRPDPVDWIQRYKKDEKEFLSVRPGITGYNQAYYRNNADSKLKLLNDRYYANNISFALDVKIFFMTIKTVFKHDNIYVDEKRKVLNEDELIS